MEIGKRIIKLREAASWTTNRLANLCGLPQSFLRSVELGEKGISVENLQLICDTLHIFLRDFFDIPSEQDTEQDRLLRQITKLTDEQKLALLSFLESMAK